MCLIHWTMHPKCSCEHIHRTPSYCDSFAIANPQYFFEEKIITYIPALHDLRLDRDHIHFRGHTLSEEKRPDHLSCTALETRFELPPLGGCPLCTLNKDVVKTMQEAKLTYEDRVDELKRKRFMKGIREELAREEVESKEAMERERNLLKENRKIRDQLEHDVADMMGYGNGA